MLKIINISNLFTNNKTFIKYLISILILIIINLVLSFIKDSTEDEMIIINNKYDKIKQLNNDEFVLNHLFEGDTNNIKNFIDYVTKYLINNHSEIISIKTIDNTKLNDITVETIQFELTFIHDKFIFELLELIQNYSPGFVRITDVYIEKNEKFNINQNNLKVNMLCVVYTKLS
ncbi:MAG: hypothetical protein IJ848_02915 [Alphaproteobacteria bacterium]|nr:hypothetical protein [Alphaproteobacteria bacterium]